MKDILGELQKSRSTFQIKQTLSYLLLALADLYYSSVRPLNSEIVRIIKKKFFFNSIAVGRVSVAMNAAGCLVAQLCIIAQGTDIYKEKEV